MPIQKLQTRQSNKPAPLDICNERKNVQPSFLNSLKRLCVESRPSAAARPGPDPPDGPVIETRHRQKNCVEDTVNIQGEARFGRVVSDTK